MKEKVVFIGSGDMSRHVAHHMLEEGAFDVVGYYDDYTPLGPTPSGIEVIGRLDDIVEDFKKGKFNGLVNGIGFTRMDYRKEVFERFCQEIPFVNYIHKTCIVDSTAKLGQGVILMADVMLYMDAVVDDNVYVNPRSFITHARVRKHSIISSHVIVAGRGDVGESCNIGVSTCVSSDVVICNGVRTGAGTVVVRNITEPGLYVGAPARKISDTV